MSCDLMPRLEAAGESHRGCVRRRNEDNFCFVSLNPDYLMTAVADGVGGYSGGEVASYLCCHRLMLDWKDFILHNPEPSAPEIAGFLQRSLEKANEEIYIANCEHKKTVPMCTTAAVAVFTPDMVITAHVGDSRIYCVRNGKCMLLTVDHTACNEIMEKGLTASVSVPGPHIISRAVGSFKELQVEQHSYFRSRDDRFLLCSDGLSNLWSQAEIQQVLAENHTPREINDRFIRGTLHRGAGDNVTVISVVPQKCD